MTILAPAQLEGPEPALAGMHYANGSCLQIAVASIATDWTQAVHTPQEIDQLLPAAPTHSIEQGGVVLDRFGIPYNLNDGTVPMRQYLRTALENRHECIVEYQCDSQCMPVPVGTSGIRHFVPCYGYDQLTNEYWVMQSWTRKHLAYPAEMFEAADTRQHLEILGIMPKDRPLTPPEVTKVLTASGKIVAWTWEEKNNQQHTAHVDAAGYLHHSWWAAGMPNWGTEKIDFGGPLVPNSDIALYRSPNQYHLVVLAPDGALRNAYQGDSESKWIPGKVA